MSAPVGFSHLLNRSEEERAYSQPNAVIPSSSASRRASISNSPRGHKYSSSQDSDSSFDSSTPQLGTPSHSRTASHSTIASQSTNPPTPPSPHSLTGRFTPLLYFDTCNKMADMADNEAGRPTIRDGEDRLQNHASRFTSHHGQIDLTDERIESPTDAAMPLISRSAAVLATAAPTTAPTAVFTAAGLSFQMHQ